MRWDQGGTGRTDEPFVGYVALPVVSQSDQLLTRTNTYCICHGGWARFMIACDSCHIWYHGGCVGVTPRTAEDATEAAFRRFICPTCDQRPDKVTTVD